MDLWDITGMDKGAYWRGSDCEEQKEDLPKRPWRNVSSTVIGAFIAENDNISDVQG